jgi:hypothetical protein
MPAAWSETRLILLDNEITIMLEATEKLQVEQPSGTIVEGTTIRQQRKKVNHLTS